MHTHTHTHTHTRIRIHAQRKDLDTDTDTECNTHTVIHTSLSYTLGSTKIPLRFATQNMKEQRRISFSKKRKEAHFDTNGTSAHIETRLTT